MYKVYVLAIGLTVLVAAWIMLIVLLWSTSV